MTMWQLQLLVLLLSQVLIIQVWSGSASVDAVDDNDKTVQNLVSTNNKKIAKVTL